MEFENIIVERQDRIAKVTLNRPERLNALSGALMADLDVALADLNNDRSVSVVIIKGAGRAFCTGYDVNPNTAERRGGMVDIAADRERLNNNVERWLRVWDLRKVVIAQVHGYCVAGGTQLALMCDLTIVAEDTRIGMPSFGPLGAGLCAAEWCHLVGPKKTKEIFFNIGKMIDGKEAERIGWANRAVPADRLEEEVNSLAEQIAQCPLDILLLHKTAINRYVEMTGLRTGMLYGADIDAISHFTKPFQQFLQMIRERGLQEAKERWRSELTLS